MKQIVEFAKEINFDTKVDEVTSISLDIKINEVKDNVISGVFDLYLEYKESDISVDVEKYSSSIPFDITIDSKYLLDDVKVDIDDFYYEIEGDKVTLHISVLVDNLSYNDIAIEKEVPMRESTESQDDIEEPIYQSFDPEIENYVTYNVHIVRDDDNIESICLKYGVTKEDLSYYNDISTIKLGDKLIVPTHRK